MISLPMLPRQSQSKGNRSISNQRGRGFLGVPMLTFTLLVDHSKKMLRAGWLEDDRSLIQQYEMIMAEVNDQINRSTEC